MKTIKIGLLFLLSVFSLASFAQSSAFYDFNVKTLEGGDFDFSTLKGKKVMVVNTASKCGFTPQYMDSEVKWNFQKYLIDENGKLVDVIYSKDKPSSEKVIGWISSK